MDDPTDLPTDRVPLGPDLKLFGAKASALLDDLPPIPPPRPVSVPKLPDPPAAEKPAEVVKVDPPAAPPAPQPRWVKEAIGNLLKPSRRKATVAAGMVCLAGGATAVRLFTTSSTPTTPTAAALVAKNAEESAAQPAATPPPDKAPAANTTTATESSAPAVNSVALPPVNVVANNGGNSGSLAAPELPPVAAVISPSVAAPIQPPAAPQVAPEATPVLPAVGLSPPAPLPMIAPANTWNPPAASGPPGVVAGGLSEQRHDPVYPHIRHPDAGPGALGGGLAVADRPAAAAALPIPTPTGARLDSALVQAGATEPPPPTVPTTPPAVTLPVPAPVIPQPAAPTVPVAPPKDKEPLKPAADLPKPAAQLAPPTGGAPTVPTATPAPTAPAPGVQPPSAVSLPTPGGLPAPEAKPSPFKDVTSPAVEQPRLAAPAIEPTAVPSAAPAPLEFTKPSGAGAVAPAAATAAPAPAAKPTPFSYDVDLYTPKANDNYDGISKLHYGDPRYSRALEAFNAERGGRLGDGRDVEVPPVWVLRQRYARFVGASRPTQPEPARDRGAEWAPAGGREPAEPRTFTVGSRGATFRQVAETVYGDSRQWSRIWELNPKYRADDELPSGTTLKLPTDAPRVRPAADR